MKKEKTKGLNDGYVGIYKPKEVETDFGAKTSPKSLDNLEHFVDMAYKEEYKREQDYDFAEAVGHSLSLKIRTLLYDELTKDYKAVVDAVLYNILKIDYAKEDNVMYLYLEEERSIA